jgi:hypothetical protein
MNQRHLEAYQDLVQLINEGLETNYTTDQLTISENRKQLKKEVKKVIEQSEKDIQGSYQILALQLAAASKRKPLTKELIQNYIDDITTWLRKEAYSAHINLTYSYLDELDGVTDIFINKN